MTQASGPQPVGHAAPAVVAPPAPSRAAAAMERLVDRLLARGVVPFIGAGVSREAEYKPSEGWEAWGKPDTKELEERARRILRRRGQSDVDGLRLSGLAEELTNLGLVAPKALGIERFADLRPTAAHRYIAYLVHEGLIERVYTTNYDTCLEQSLAEGCPGAEFRVLINRATYPPQSPALFKINGCARSYRDKVQNYTEIRLTDRDIGSFLGQNWLEQAFEVDCRDLCLVFSGFSANEPQVEGVLDRVAKEYRRVPKRQPLDSERVHHEPNAPVFHSYTFDPEEPHRDILRLFHAAKIGRRDRDLTLDDEVQALTNCYSGRDGAYFHVAGPNLPADDFWRVVFVETWRRIALGGARGHQALHAVLGRDLADDLAEGHLDRLAIQLVEALFEPGHPDRARACPLLTLRSKEEAPPIANAIRAMSTDGHAAPSHPYYSWSQDPMAVALIVVLHACVGRDPGSPDPSLGYRLTREEDEVQVYLVRANPARRAMSGYGDDNVGVPDTLNFVQIVVPEGRLGRFSGMPLEVERVVHHRVLPSPEGDALASFHGCRVDARQLLPQVVKKAIDDGQGIAPAFWDTVRRLRQSQRLDPARGRPHPRLVKDEHRA